MPWVKVSDDAAPSAKQGSSLVLALIDEALEYEVPRSWHESVACAHLGGVSSIPDFTGGRWPHMCNERERFTRPGGELPVRVWCTRTAGHTGRHAAGRHGRVLAVWEAQDLTDTWRDVGYLLDAYIPEGPFTANARSHVVGGLSISRVAL